MPRSSILLVLKFPATPFAGFLECVPTTCGTWTLSQRQTIERAETNYRLIPKQVDIIENTGVCLGRPMLCEGFWEQWMFATSLVSQVPGGQRVSPVLLQVKADRVTVPGVSPARKTQP